MSALELAGRALQAVEGDEALALVQSERSGMARFAGSEVHQPTLIENETVELQVVRDGRLGIAKGNRTDDEGLAFALAGDWKEVLRHVGGKDGPRRRRAEPESAGSRARSFHAPCIRWRGNR